MGAKQEVLNGKKVLIVDDEPDVLDSLEEILDMCKVSKAGSFEAARKELESHSFDIAILDIMGVDGYSLLDLAVQKKVTAVMLTAHALSPEDTIKSFKGGAAFYVPKDKITELPTILANILDLKKQGKSTWMPFVGWAEAYYNAKFGPKWEKQKKELLENLN